VRRILLDARTPVHYAMFAPVHRAMRGDDRVRFSFIASEEPERAAAIYRDAAGPGTIVGRVQAALTRFDAYLTADFMWTRLVHPTCRIQMFHGVGGKYGFDAPTESLRAWHRLFFVNERRLANCVAAGALDGDSPAIRLIGMPKVDCLVDGSIRRDEVLARFGLPPDRATVLYAPTWSPASSLNKLGVDLIRAIAALPVNLIVKLHDRSRDPRPQYSGGIDWAAAVAPHLCPGRAVLAEVSDICPCLAAADVMITDHSSAGFEYLLLDRPLVRIDVPELIELANIHRDYVGLLADVSDSTRDVDDTIAALERALADPARHSSRRRDVAAELFHAPGGATARCAAALYEAIELEAPAVATAAAPSPLVPSSLSAGALASVPPCPPSP
jgi:CDP-glycerol glycerophosphotransferase (TagB/SpsB family)